MNRRHRRATLALLLATLLTVVPTLVFAADDTEFAASDTSTWYIGMPVTDGEYVLWHEGSTSVHSPCDTVIGARLDTRTPFLVADYCGGSFALANGNAVWTTSAGDSDGDQVLDIAAGVFLADLAAAEIYTIAVDVGFGAWGVATDGELVAWIQSTGVSEDSPLQILSRPFGPSVGPALVREAAPGVTIGNLLIHNDAFFWMEYSANDPAGVATIYKWKPESEPQPQFAAPAVRWFGLLGTGDIVYHSGDQLFRAAPGAADGTLLATGVAGATSTDGRYVLWATEEYPERITLRGIDLVSDAHFTAYEQVGGGVEVLGRIGESSIANGVLAWSRYAYNQYMSAVHAAWLVDRLPSARRSDPGTIDPNWTYYSETGHYLSGGFRAFWTRGGGLPVFGFPLTEEFSEHGFAVQYLERQRFEWHPENAGTPYEVLLGLLGAEDAAQRGLLASESFLPVGDGEPPPTCRAFPETRHHVCGAFLDAWTAAGLEFGDPGVSYREALALFGFPISEAFTDPATGLLVQYFERAIFEWHEENAGTPYDVLLRRLGADVLAERGWQ